MLLLLLLPGLCVGLDISLKGRPDAVKNLRAAQEGFEGVVSLSWESPAKFPGNDHDYFDLSVIYPNRTIVNLGKPRAIPEHLESVKVEGAKALTTYQLMVAAVSANRTTEIRGKSTTAEVTFQESDTAILEPTDFRYVQQDTQYYSFYIQWDRADQADLRDQAVWYYIRLCKSDDDTMCSDARSDIPSVILFAPGNSDTYNLQIYAHAKGVQATDPARSSHPLLGVIKSVPIWTWPVPENGSFVRENEDFTLDQVAYTFSWTMSPHASLIGISVSVYKPSHSLFVLETVTEAHATSLPLRLDFDTNYNIKCNAIYDLGLNRTVHKQGISLSVHTAEGPSSPVRNFRASQIGSPDEVILTWEPARKTNGPLSYYLVRVMNEEGIDVQPNIKLDLASRTVPVTIQNPKFGVVYDISITPVGPRRGGGQLFGQVAVCSISLNEHSGGPDLPPWAIVLIVLVAVLSIAGGVFIWMRRR